MFDCTIAIDYIKRPSNCDVSTSKAISISGIGLLLDLDLIQGDIPNQFCRNLLYFIAHKDCPEISYGMIRSEQGCWTRCYAWNIYY